MVEFTKKELLNLARISSLKLYDNEIDYLKEQLQKTLDYTKQLDQFETKMEHDAVKNINVFREDKAIPKDSAPLLAQAPATKETYFVVPKVLD